MTQTEIETEAHRPIQASRLATARYRAAQAVRVGWYAAHSFAARSLAAPLPRGEGAERPGTLTASGDRREARRLRAALSTAFARAFALDRANIAQGLYPAPRDLDPFSAPDAVVASVRFFADVPKVDARRRAARGGVEVREHPGAGRYPAYYRQNFHYQTDGWFSERSAALYDTQVEVLFTGAADAMRRAALGVLGSEWRGRDQRGLRHLDVACGAGRFLAQIAQAYPRLQATGVDLSPAYVATAAARLAKTPSVSVREANAEALPFEDGCVDTSSCVYLFHELPPRVRPTVAGELARVTRPGGLIVIADALQTGDDPALDGLLASFPALFHEPYFKSYLSEDLDALMARHGCKPVVSVLSYLTKVRAYRVPERA